MEKVRHPIATLCRLLEVSRRGFYASCARPDNPRICEGRKLLQGGWASRKWAADITFVWTRSGWLDMAPVIDLYSHRVVGWTKSARMTRQLANTC